MQLDRHIDHVEPSSGVGSVAVAIYGRFPARVTKHLSGKAAATVDTAYRAWLGEVELQEVMRVDETQLTAVVPALPAGAYTLAVLDPYGERFELVDAFVVNGTPPVIIDVPAALSQSVAAVPNTVSTGQVVTFMTTVTNPRNAPVDLVPSITLTGSATLTPLSSPSAQTIGASATFVFTFSADTAGDVFATFSAADLAPASTSLVTVVNRAALALVDFVVAPTVLIDTAFTATLTLQNTGEAAALWVAPTPSATPATILGGASASFDLTFDATTLGAFTLNASATGTDEHSGAEVSILGLMTSTTVVAPATTESLAVDPFGDGTSFSHLFSYDGKIYLGPRKDGAGAVRMNPDGTGAESVAFSLPKDTTVQTSRNTSAAPFSSIGATGCAANTAACGPDNENGRGVFFSGIAGGDEWLAAVGSRSAGDLDYLYLSRSTGTTIAFAYVDISTKMDASAHTLSAAIVFHDHLYLGANDAGGDRPTLMRLEAWPAWPSSLDASNTQIVDLHAHSVPGLDANTMALIDTFAVYGDRLYFANNGAWVRTTNSAPTGVPSDWQIITPSAGAYASKISVTTTKVSDFEPADRAVPAMVEFHGKLYAARNTSSGPQLFACTACDAADWAPVDVGGDANDTHVTLLAATGTTLYVGFNNAVSGVHLWKTTGAGFTQVTTGFGTAVTRVFDARAIGAFLYFTAGDGTSGVHVYRVAD